RRKGMKTHDYPSDLTDAQWTLIEPHIPAVQPGGRPRKTDMRDVVDAILYILRTGCQWRYLPGDLPPKSTVWRYFDRWRRDGILDAIHDPLRKKVRTEEKPYEWVEANAGWDLAIVRRPKDAEGWVKLPIRWTVERTFAWLGRCRRLSKDREKSVLSSESFVKLAMIHMMLKRLEPSGTEAD